jgi:hypothetical protein
MIKNTLIYKILKQIMRVYKERQTGQKLSSGHCGSTSSEIKRNKLIRH